MFFFNLSALEFLALFSAVSAAVVALYLLSRARRKQNVATLLFWQQAQHPVATSQRRRVQQPLSLLLQLLGICLLLLAVAQLRLGSRVTSSRDHVLVLDTSSWMAARSQATSSRSSDTLMDEAKQRASEYVRSVPPTDRVMLIRADAVPTPATGMEARRNVLLSAINHSSPAATALNLDQSLSFASRVLRLRSNNPGEIAFIGSNRTSLSGVPQSLPPGLRVIPVSSSGENTGFAKLGLRRSPEDVELWQCFVSVRNTGSKPQNVPVILQFGGAPVASKTLAVPPNQVVEAILPFRTRAGGWLEARILSTDVLADDNRALIELPPLQPLKLTVFTDDAAFLRPALKALPFVEATFRPTSSYGSVPRGSAVILDRFTPSKPLNVSTLWIDPPGSAASPFKVRETLPVASVVKWAGTHDISLGLNTRRFEIANAKVYSLREGDVPIAETARGAVIVARPEARSVVFGFNPGSREMRTELPTALLLANALRWINSTVFQASEVFSTPVGSVSVPVDRFAQPSELTVAGEQGDLPFTAAEGTLRFFSASPDVVRVRGSGADQVYSLSLPEIATTAWEIPSGLLTGVPGSAAQVFSKDLWQWLAAAGALVLLAEWLLFASPSPMVKQQETAAPPGMRKAS